MKAAVLVDVGRIELRDVPCPAPAPREVLVRVTGVGLCGTDFHIFAGHANYNRDGRGRAIPPRNEAQILGHEIAGVVEETGGAVDDLGVGDRVVVDQGRNCVSEARSPRCEYCASGDSHQCAFYREHGITGLPGGFAEYVTIPAVNAVRTDTSLDDATAALTEPLGCVVHSADVLLRMPGRYALEGGRGGKGGQVSHVLICGAGPAGLLWVQYLRKEVVHERTHGRGAELLIEATGSGQAFAAIPGLVRKQGTVLLYGHGHTGVDLSVLSQLQFREPTLLAPVGASGGFEPDGRPATYVRALRLIERGQVDVASLITHRYPSLDSVPRAFAGDHGAADYVKGVVTCASRCS